MKHSVSGTEMPASLKHCISPSISVSSHTNCIITVSYILSLLFSWVAKCVYIFIHFWALYMPLNVAILYRFCIMHVVICDQSSLIYQIIGILCQPLKQSLYWHNRLRNNTMHVYIIILEYIYTFSQARCWISWPESYEAFPPEIM